jgi:hypothetical protein
MSFLIYATIKFAPKSFRVPFQFAHGLAPALKAAVTGKK